MHWPPLTVVASNDQWYHISAIFDNLPIWNKLTLRWFPILNSGLIQEQRFCIIDIKNQSQREAWWELYKDMFLPGTDEHWSVFGEVTVKQARLIANRFFRIAIHWLVEWNVNSSSQMENWLWIRLESCLKNMAYMNIGCVRPFMRDQWWSPWIKALVHQKRILSPTWQPTSQGCQCMETILGCYRWGQWLGSWGVAEVQDEGSGAMREVSNLTVLPLLCFKDKLYWY